MTTDETDSGMVDDNRQFTCPNCGSRRYATNLGKFSAIANSLPPVSQNDAAARDKAVEALFDLYALGVCKGTLDDGAPCRFTWPRRDDDKYMRALDVHAENARETLAKTPTEPAPAQVEIGGIAPIEFQAYSAIRIQVLEFMRAFQPEMVQIGIGVPSTRIVRLRVALVLEEALEMLEACVPNDSVHVRDKLHAVRQHVKHLIDIHVEAECVDMEKFADACADVDYVVEGARIAFGINGAPIAAEVHRSNMDKKRGHRRDDGKWMKPADWKAPDILGELYKQGWRGA